MKKMRMLCNNTGRLNVELLVAVKSFYHLNKNKQYQDKPGTAIFNKRFT